ncbi:uncharacterized protein BT62DRAFT_931464 [Guyanagaster necrorhizus]|uniref:Secreted protein n=1 Tax=Guyanagaster necrorhizus TaxID=856835 RepID=A0A9P7VVZ5_9AGAR|nr:uncharacterized protein BT62DRAFT_931464 [Guyanagaster necrorhizus MCA 3950]KAG7446891.1 hypothetical protein BT62DRAFT_931464 [Guyanagaster necrorhizus MCA 3950]
MTWARWICTICWYSLAIDAYRYPYHSSMTPFFPAQEAIFSVISTHFRTESLGISSVVSISRRVNRDHRVLRIVMASDKPQGAMNGSVIVCMTKIGRFREVITL